MTNNYLISLEIENFILKRLNLFYDYKMASKYKGLVEFLIDYEKKKPSHVPKSLYNSNLKLLKDSLIKCLKRNENHWKEKVKCSSSVFDIIEIYKEVI